MIRGVNLLPAKRKLARQCRRYRLRWTAGLAVYATVMAGVWLVSHQLGTGPEAALADEVYTVRRQIADAEQNLAQVTPRLAQAKQTLAANRSVALRPNWSLLLDLLADLLDDQTMLRGVELRPLASGSTAATHDDTTAYRLRIRGVAESQTAVMAYVLRLEATGLFDHVKPVGTQPEPFRDQRLIGFEIECHLGAKSEGAP